MEGYIPTDGGAHRPTIRTLVLGAEGEFRDRLSVVRHGNLDLPTRGYKSTPCDALGMSEECVNCTDGAQRECHIHLEETRLEDVPLCEACADDLGDVNWIEIDRGVK